MNNGIQGANRTSVCGSFPASLFVALGSIGIYADPAPAQTAFSLPAPPFQLPLLPSPSGAWTVTVGVGGEYKPDYEGSKHSMLSPVPIFSIRRAGSTQQFCGANDASSIALFQFGNLRAGPALKFKSARKADRHSELNGLGDVKATAEVGGFVEYYPVDWLRSRVEVRQGIGGHTGVVADFSADAVVPIDQRLTISAGPRFTVESARAAIPYFGVSTAQAIASGLPTFNPGGGMHSIGIGAQATYKIDPRWEVRSYIEYKKLLGDVAGSPLVTLRGSTDQTTFGIGVSYSFDIKIR
ncbi:MipA/OmpV family protein [Bradyrhizobium sp. Arg237L]|uniref:MipA/OmpV family protein n=1 Tax=Bradyrhizobium sp. Arg237L TaxID=3003352 RepID=UPI00249F8CCF|nr:MipA/OmpV family protein [Bradyrhizobium sp. Arg237L]MDI4238291.1 MipA/OmpV family protein [Bradyrhizobium sp. Arg237L]